MTIEQYYEVIEHLKTLSDSEKEFVRNICIASGHDWFKDANKFADVCVRCGQEDSWIDKYTSQQAALEVAAAHAIKVMNKR